MKILMINTRLRLGAGDVTYMLNLSELLKLNGHEVAFFCMHDCRNIESKYNDYFVSEVNYGQLLKNFNIISSLSVVAKSIYRFETKQKLRRVLQEFGPDVVHINSLDKHLTVSAIHEIKNNKVPIVWTVHNYEMLCINGTFLNDKTNEICEKCKDRRFIKALCNRCKKGSYGASAIGSLYLYFCYYGGFYNHVDCFIAPSMFLKKKLTDWNITETNIEVIQNFVNPSSDISDNSSKKSYGLFIGRLSKEKGLKTLVDALKVIPKVPFKIVGDGPLFDELKLMVQEMKNVELLGHKSGNDLRDLIKNSLFGVVPSIWYENQPFAITELFANGKPVIGSNIGGMRELINNLENGMLFEVGNYQELADCMTLLYENENLVKKMGKNALNYVYENLHPDVHLKKIMQVYHSVLQNTH